MLRFLLTPALLLAFVPATAAKRKTNPCDSRGTTITVSAYARVFALVPKDGSPDSGYDRAFYACLRRSRKFRFIAGEGGGGSHDFAGPFQLAGTLVGFAQVHCLSADCQYTAESLDLRSGRRVQEHFDDGHPLALKMSRSGSLVLINEFPDASYEVRRIARNGVKVLDHGTDIDPASLALAHRSVRWTRGGQPHSAPIL